PPALRQHAPHAPAELELVLARCLAKRPEHRPATMTAAWEEIRAALRRAADPGLAPTVPPDQPTVPPLPRGEPPAITTGLRGAIDKPGADAPSRVRWIVPLALLGAVGTIVVIVQQRQCS